ncbi:MAG TPA: endonuclease/exonuclease/phosphatase family protein, partial [Polyangiaceae bacterium]
MTLRVASLNIWNRMGPWDDRLAAIVHGVGKIAPDIFGLQEVITWPGTFEQAKVLEDALKMNVYFGRHPDSEFPMGNAIASKFPLENAQTFPL